MGEITTLAIILANYPSQMDNAVHFVNTLTIVKYNLTPVCFVLPIIGFCGKIIVMLLQKRMKKIEQ
ncbi:MAG: hypothetical protein GX154_08285 [Clostridiales bacterium]|nr:hypothetical protein [Clostridiales bacterium]